MQVKTETEKSFKACFDTVNELRNSSSYICENGNISREFNRLKLSFDKYSANQPLDSLFTLSGILLKYQLQFSCK